MGTKSYTLSHRAPFTAEWRTSRYGDLAGALVAAWRKHKRYSAVGAVEQGQRVMLDGEALARALARMDELLAERPKPSAREAAERVAREIIEPGDAAGPSPE